MFETNSCTDVGVEESGGGAQISGSIRLRLNTTHTYEQMKNNDDDNEL